MPAARGLFCLFGVDEEPRYLLLLDVPVTFRSIIYIIRHHLCSEKGEHEEEETHKRRAELKQVQLEAAPQRLFESIFRILVLFISARKFYVSVNREL
jgi:hypothetical protein